MTEGGERGEGRGERGDGREDGGRREGGGEREITRKMTSGCNYS